MALRTEVAATKGTPIRVLQILDSTMASEGAAKALQLWWIGPDLRLVLWADVSRRDSQAIYSLRASGMKGEIVFSVSEKDPELVTADRRAGVGVLVIGGERVVLKPEDARSQTVRSRISGLLAAALGKGAFDEFQSAVNEVGKCGLRLARGKLLPIIAPDAYGMPNAPCRASFSDKSGEKADPSWESAFVPVDPAVRDFLRLDTRAAAAGEDE